MKKASCVLLVLISLFLYSRSGELRAEQSGKQPQSTKSTVEMLFSAEQKVRLESLQKKESGLLDALDQMDRRRLEIVLRTQKLKRQIATLKPEAEKAKARWDTQKAVCDALEGKIRPRVRLFYRIARLGHARLLMDTKNLNRLAWRWKALQKITERDLKMLVLYQRLYRQAEKSAKIWHRKAKSVQNLLATLEKEEMKLLRSRKLKEMGLDIIYKKKHIYQKAIAEMSRSTEKLQTMVTRFKVSGMTEGVKQVKGELPWPVPGYTPYCEAYSLKRSGSFVALACQKILRTPHPWRGALGRLGITLKVPDGTPVFAVASGRVVHVGWLKGYGQLMMIDHGQRLYSIYSHLSHFAVRNGTLVQTSQKIAESGSSGINKGLYFELRHIARVVPPEEWLRKISPP